MTKLVGILNITPDSFSDGGQFLTPDAALRQVEKLFADGADVVDIGAESTRPGATPLSADEEWARLEPVLAALPHGAYSIDTRHAQTARNVSHLGWINDVSGFAPDMTAAVKDSQCKLVVMHSLSVPADQAIVIDESQDAVEVVLDFARHKIAELEAAGIERDRVIFDPGLGFGKTAKQSMRIVEEIGRFKTLGVPLFVGHSRKSFLGENKDEATLRVSKFLIEQQVEYIRVHDVAAHRKLIENE